MYFGVLCNVLSVLRNVPGVLRNVLSVLRNVPGDPRNIFLVLRAPKAYCVGALTVGALKKQKRRKKQRLTNLKGRALHWPNNATCMNVSMLYEGGLGVLAQKILKNLF